MKLNVGCGTDYREGYINIDGSSSVKTDKIVDVGSDSLLNYFAPESVDYILANDIVEHLFHWEAVSLLKDFYKILKPGGVCEVRVPDAEAIIKYLGMPINRKLNLLFGGQDIPQGLDVDMDESRRAFPQYFCHKFGWTRKNLSRELLSIGFSNVKTKRARTNFIAISIK